MSGRDNSDLSQIQHFPNMKHKPHNFTFRLVACFAAILAGTAPFWLHHRQATAQEETPSADTAALVSSTTIRDDLNSEDLLASVREKLDAIESLQCEIYETVHLSDQRFYATGTYSQASGNRVRLEYQIFPIRGVRSDDAEHLAIGGPPEDTGKQKPTAEFSQISDGGVLWTLWKNGDKTRLTRRSIREILEAADQAKDFESAQILEDLGTGGLQTLIARLQTGMEFSKVREQTVGDTRLLLLSGRWTDDAREQYFKITDPKAAMPEWLPDYVRLFVDAEALLPRRIEYLKKHPNPEQKLVRPLIKLDFRKMSINEVLPEDWFVFTAPEGLPEEDLTLVTVEQIKKMANSGDDPGATDPVAADSATDNPEEGNSP